MVTKAYLKLFLLVLTFSITKAFSQSEEDAVKASINQLFEGMRKTDTTLMRSTFSADGTLQSAIVTRDGKTKVIQEPIDSFMAAVGRPHKEIYDERISYDVIKIDGPLAIVWAPYSFYIGDKLSHCGVDSFQLVKIDGKWKIQYIIDTRRRENCK
jgi:hypothetical protein